MQHRCQLSIPRLQRPCLPCMYVPCRHPTWNTRGRTSWSRSITSTQRTVAWDVMFTWFKGIWFTCCGVAIESTGWKTMAPIGNPPIQPLVTPWQHEVRSSAEYMVLILPFVAIQTRSENISAAPKAQQEPHAPWSQIWPITVQSGQAVLESKVAGIPFTISIFCRDRFEFWES